MKKSKENCSNLGREQGKKKKNSHTHKGLSHSPKAQAKQIVAQDFLFIEFGTFPTYLNFPIPKLPLGGRHSTTIQNLNS
ncbi:unnamed protein product [Victoria cruziana]